MKNQVQALFKAICNTSENSMETSITNCKAVWKVKWPKDFNNIKTRRLNGKLFIKGWHQKHGYHRSSKKSVLKNFVNFARKHVMECLFDKVAVLRPATLLTKDSNTGLFVWNLRNFLTTPILKDIYERLLLLSGKSQRRFWCFPCKPGKSYRIRKWFYKLRSYEGLTKVILFFVCLQHKAFLLS